MRQASSGADGATGERLSCRSWRVCRPLRGHQWAAQQEEGDEQDSCRHAQELTVQAQQAYTINRTRAFLRLHTLVTLTGPSAYHN